MSGVYGRRSAASEAGCGEARGRVMVPPHLYGQVMNTSDWLIMVILSSDWSAGRHQTRPGAAAGGGDILAAGHHCAGGGGGAETQRCQGRQVMLASDWLLMIILTSDWFTGGPRRSWSGSRRQYGAWPTLPQVPQQVRHFIKYASTLYE